MFESMTYEYIINNMLSNVNSDVDKREGSIIYDALAPIAYLLAQTYYNLDQFVDLVSGDTAVGEYLDRVVADYGITRKAATYSVRKIETTGAVEIGTRWGLEDTTYSITELISDNLYKATCEQLGEIGNTYSGTLQNIDNVSGVTASLTDIIISGEEEETDDNLRTRFYIQVQSPITSGNADNYIKWALEVPGVGKAKVFPLWNGPGTVKVLVVDENMSIVKSLETTVADYIESVRPIGASVTVDSPVSLSIDVTANVVLDGSRTLSDVQADFIVSLTNYLKETVFSTYNVSYAKVGSLLLAVEGVDDHNGLLINGGISSIILNDTEMPICGTVTISEVI